MAALWLPKAVASLRLRATAAADSVGIVFVDDEDEDDDEDDDDAGFFEASVMTSIRRTAAGNACK